VKFKTVVHGVREAGCAYGRAIAMGIVRWLNIATRPFKDHPVLNGVIAAAVFVGLAAGILIIGLWLAGRVPTLAPLPK
jgi:hypothetical protein